MNGRLIFFLLLLNLPHGPSYILARAFGGDDLGFMRHRGGDDLGLLMTTGEGADDKGAITRRHGGDDLGLMQSHGSDDLGFITRRRGGDGSDAG